MRNIFNDLLSAMCLADLLVIISSFVTSTRSLQIQVYQRLLNCFPKLLFHSFILLKYNILYFKAAVDVLLRGSGFKKLNALLYYGTP